MTSLSNIWPTEHPDWIQLYSINSPNGVKVAVMLEETGLPYAPHLINLWEGEQNTVEFRSISPNGKIPIIIDPAGPNDRSMVMMESGAILLYLAEKSGCFLPEDAVLRNECIQWLFFQMAHIGPMFGQFEHFHRRGGENARDPHAIERYRNESTRLLGVLEGRLTDRKNLMGEEYTIADIATFPWIRSMWRLEKEGLPFEEVPNVVKWFHTCMDRPASQTGIEVNAVPNP